MKILTPEATFYHPHLRDIAATIPALDPQADILLLLGRDVIQAYKALDQRNQFAQRFALGWVIVGGICLAGAQTNILDDGSPSYFFPCQNSIQVNESFSFQVIPRVTHIWIRKQPS